MDDGPASTPDPLDAPESHDNPSTASRIHASKDRECPYCHQPFTSSSLGRHLDQYIKPENPKQPDGIHDVDAIRKERGGITRRRKGRASDRHESVDTPPLTVATPTSSNARQGSPAVTVSPLNAPPKEGMHFRINSLTWHSTGVINEALGGSARPNSVSSMTAPGPISKRTAVKSEIMRRQDALADRDTARALELALREVLDNVRAANARAQTAPSPFEFELQSQSFPALCLQCLPPPPSLFSVQPFSTSFSWPLDPPGTPQLDSVRQYLRSQIHQWRMSQNASLRRSNAKAAAAQKEYTERLAKEYEDTVTSHLSAAFKHWSSLPATQQHETYHLEILRAFARETEKRKSVDAQLVRVQQEADHLRAQVEKLSSCQNPREFTLLPPETISISRAAARDIHSSSSRFEDWDYDRLLSKWQGVVKGDRRSKTGLGSQRPLPPLETDALSRSMSTPGIISNGHHTADGSGQSSSNAPTSSGSRITTPQSARPMGSATRMNGNGSMNQDAEGEDETDTGYGQILMEMGGEGRGGRYVEMTDAD